MPSGTVITDTYDASTGRLSTVTSRPTSGPTLTQTYSYVPAGQPGAGRIRTVTDGTSTVTLGYDADGACRVPGLLRRHGDVGEVPGQRTADHHGRRDRGGHELRAGQPGPGQDGNPDTRGNDARLGHLHLRLHVPGRDDEPGNGVTTTNAWTAHNQLSTQRTTTASGAVVEEHLYTYDDHGNVSTRIDRTEAGTWTTRYAYDAYDRLVSSAVYPGVRGSGRPVTSTAYTLSTAGDVVSTTTSSSSPTRTTTTTNTIDPAGQLTAQTTNGTAVQQAFDGDGRVLTSLSGWAMTYDSFGRMLTASKGGTTSTYAYWADGTPRSTTTVSPSSSVCDQAIAQAGTGQGTYGRYRLVRAPAEGGSGSDVVVGTDGPDRLVGRVGQRRALRTRRRRRARGRQRQRLPRRRPW